MPADDRLAREVAQRRTFAIISHPDAGKTTLTEKLLLFSGAVHEAGAVKSRKQAKQATSDWMKLEQERGISISSTVLHFAYAAPDRGPEGGWRFNLLDTPGHADFSEDTYRTLCAADAAVMVLDMAKGLEPQTLKLFRVCADRGLPIVTFVNKCDRPGMAPLELLDEITSEIGLEPVAQTWPVADGADFAGVIDRSSNELVRFDRTVHGATVGEEERIPVEKAQEAGGEAFGCPEDRFEAAFEELELLEVDQPELDREAFLAGRQTPVFFGSALANFGVRLLLEGFADLAPHPTPQPTVEPGEPRPIDEDFSGQVFKVQANMNPKHRDRVAFLRVNSGWFQRGGQATLARTGRQFPMKYAHQLFADDRETAETAVAGDIVGLVNASGLQPGDTLYAGKPVTFPPIPTFSPERFARIRNRDSSRYKQFRSALRQLDEEGVVQVLQHPELGEQEPILAGVGQLQFEVAKHRMTNEFGCTVELEPTPYELAREVSAEDAERVRDQRGTMVARDRHDRWLVLFANDFALRWAEQDFPDVTFHEMGMARS
ncbi:peptide chain release factor 3 [Egibacter rhizosphaerae]|uniref:Peptide chain release factor 3 n=1 Tax=Egibacter rhizosphaerae TaxID=1670831 RepID=A0A411YBU6_9ACTN|nr:peptide chain release factor 3 [Egibacter rhizosphaerae]QBI18674.1 peptide chain release factor 3 [Egibacter rhizosphaerae]